MQHHNLRVVVRTGSLLIPKIQKWLRKEKKGRTVWSGWKCMQQNHILIYHNELSTVLVIVPQKLVKHRGISLHSDVAES
jgi:hypothetical protein